MSGQLHERSFFSSLKTKIKMPQCAVLAKNVFALLRHLIEGTYVLFVKNSNMDLVVFLMVMILQSLTAIDGFLALVPVRNYFVNPFTTLQWSSSYSTICHCFYLGY
jgi:hypothetical protein